MFSTAMIFGKIMNLARGGPVDMKTDDISLHDTFYTLYIAKSSSSISKKEEEERKLGGTQRSRSDI